MLWAVNVTVRDWESVGEGAVVGATTPRSGLGGAPQPSGCEARGMVAPESVPMEKFEELVSLGLDAIPPGLASLMNNVAVFVEDQKPGRPGLMGLYEGIPLTKRGSGYSGALPDHITIYRRPILRRCATESDVVRQVEITVVHEVAHHFGISDARLHELGYA